MKVALDYVDLILRQEEKLFSLLFSIPEVCVIKQEHKMNATEAIDLFLTKAGKKDVLGAALLMNGIIF